MTNFILFIITLNFSVIIYNGFMWFTVQKENRELKKENKELRYLLNKAYKINDKSKIFF